MKQRAPFLFAVALVALDAGLAGLAFYVAYRLRLQTDYESIERFSAYWGMLLIHLTAITVTFFFYRLYHRPRALAHIDEFYSVFGAGSVGSIISLAIISFIYKNQLDYPRLMSVYAWILGILFIAIGRVVHSRVQWYLQGRGWGETRIAIVGTGDIGRLILQKIRQSPGLGYVLGLPVLGGTGDIARLVEGFGIKEMIIARPDAPRREILAIIAKCERERVAVKLFPDVFQMMATEVSIGDLNGLPLLTVRDISLRGWQLAIKRAIDIAGSALCLVLFSPVMLLVAILVKLETPGPVFYAQERMGLDGRSFMMLKFRSMRPGAEAKSGAVWTSVNDPRRTRFGSILRRLSIDEMPQLINVLIGDMSLVGPRPERPFFVEQFKKSIPRYMDRHREKAGLTGWAQVNGLRGNTSIVERTKYDLWYIENWSFMLDIRIIVRTISRMLHDPQAY
jgi:exopolysaccharide biosynthesis polyprenyl glycosylphosphotransferase